MGGPARLCGELVRVSESLRDLVGAWGVGEDRRAVEWFLATVVWGCPVASARSREGFDACVEGVLRDLPSGGAEACGGFRPPGRGHFLHSRPWRRAFGAYACAQRLADWRCAAAMRLAGFEAEPAPAAAGGIPCWRKGAGSGKPGLLFVHGLGIGLLPYAGLLQELSRDFDVTAPQLEHLTLSSARRMTTVQCADALHAILGGRRCSVASHSYGTMIAASLAKRHPSDVGALAVLSPACFLIHRGELQRRFLGDSGLLHRCVRNSPTVLAALAGVSWPESELWPGDVRGKRWLVVLCEDDRLVPFERTLRHVRAHFDASPGEREVLAVPGRHAGCLFEHRGRVAAAVRDVLAPGAA